MDKKIHKFTEQIGGKQLIIETGKLAGRAHGACTVQYGDTVVLATTCISKAPREGIDYFPLMVDFDEKLYAAGKIKGSRFIKREGRPSDEAILSCRLIDRAIRPFFPLEIQNDVQVVLSVLSFDEENDPDIVGLIGAVCALSISNIPWRGPIAGVRVGQINGEWVLNPSYEARLKSNLDLVIAGTYEKTVMLEAGADEVSEERVCEAIEFAKKHIGKIINLINQVIQAIGVDKMDLAQAVDQELVAQQTKVNQKVKDYLTLKKVDQILKFETKDQFSQAKEDLRSQVDELLKQDNEVSKDERKTALKIVDQILEDRAAELVLAREQRIDRRKLDQVRALNVNVGVLPRTHGSALFSRGETQVLSAVTLGAPSMEQTLDTMELSGKKRYMHHYNFPGFSVGEVSPLRGPGRRDIGHGALAEKALIPMIPTKEDFPYTIRVVSEVLSSNGSSSQASVCGSSLALMDAGVPIKKAVAGIAMGMAQDDKGNYKILTDLQDLEDSKGGMDFKIAGTQDGITAIQMDTKSDGLTIDMVKDTLTQAKKARLEILDKMAKAIKEPRKELSPYAPRIYTLKINPEKIRDLIGPAGKMINKIIDETNVTIDIEDDGLVMVTATPEGDYKRALELIGQVTAEAEVGKIYHGKVTRMFDFGAMVEFLPGQEGLIHVSEMAPFRVNTPEDVVKVGDEIPVKVVGIDEQDRVNLSLKQTDFDYSNITPPAHTERPPRAFNNRRPGDNGRFNNYRRPGGGNGKYNNYRHDRGARRPRY